MKIGIFDSGLGGLVVLKELRNKLRNFDFMYLGDTKNLPYGDKSQTRIYKLTKKAVEYLFKNNCELVLIACNTASSQALRKIQHEYLPKSKYKNRKVLGIIRPVVESTLIHGCIRVAIIGTKRTIDSKAYLRELAKINPRLKIVQKATPKLVPMIEKGHFDRNLVQDYLKPLLTKKIDALILACTHYPLIKKEIRKIVGKQIKVISPDELLPAKVGDYLKRHPEISRKLSKNGKIELLMTKHSAQYKPLVKQWFEKNSQLKIANY